MLLKDLIVRAFGVLITVSPDSSEKPDALGIANEARKPPRIIRDDLIKTDPRCLDVRGGEVKDGALVRYKCNNATTQWWTWVEGTYRQADKDGREYCLTWNSRVDVRLQPCEPNDTLHQGWEHNGAELQMLDHRICLKRPDSALELAYLASCRWTSPKPPWMLDAYPGFSWHFRTGQMRDVQGNVVQDHNLMSTHTVVPMKGCLDVSGGKLENGTLARIFPCNYAKSQAWKVVGTFVQVARKGGIQFCLDVWDDLPGREVRVWECGKGGFQDWEVLQDIELNVFAIRLIPTQLCAQPTEHAHPALQLLDCPPWAALKTNLRWPKVH